MKKVIFLPTVFLSCLLIAFSAEVHFSEKDDLYTIKLKDIGEVAASATAVFSADGKNFRTGTRDLPFQGEVRSTSVDTPFGRAIQVFGSPCRNLDAIAPSGNIGCDHRSRSTQYDHPSYAASPCGIFG